MSLRVCLLGLGEVGGIVADDLTDCATLKVYDRLFSIAASAPSRKAASAALQKGASAAEAVRDAELVVSAVTAAQTVPAAQAVASSLSPDAWYLDLNSASPGAKIDAAAMINAAGGRYVEAAVMSPFAPKRIKSPILLGGPYATAFEPVARSLGFTGVSFYAQNYGKASAAKLCRSILVKGIEALLSESLVAARHYGVEETVLSSMTDLFPGADWQRLSRYMISRAIEHGARRAEEMREAAHTVRDAGVTPLMSAATAERQDWTATFKPAFTDAELGPLLDAIRRQMDAARP